MLLLIDIPIFLSKPANLHDEVWENAKEAIEKLTKIVMELVLDTSGKVKGTMLEKIK